MCIAVAIESLISDVWVYVQVMPSEGNLKNGYYSDVMIMNLSCLQLVGEGEGYVWGMVRDFDH